MRIIILLAGILVLSSCIDEPEPKMYDYIDKPLYIVDICCDEMNEDSTVHYCKFYAANKGVDDKQDWIDFRAPCSSFTIDQQIVIKAKDTTPKSKEKQEKSKAMQDLEELLK